MIREDFGLLGRLRHWAGQMRRGYRGFRWKACRSFYSKIALGRDPICVVCESSDSRGLCKGAQIPVNASGKELLRSGGAERCAWYADLSTQGALVGQVLRVTDSEADGFQC